MKINLRIQITFYRIAVSIFLFPLSISASVSKRDRALCIYRSFSL